MKKCNLFGVSGVVALALILLAQAAWASTWPYPSEVSVTSVYNDLYSTDYANTPDGLADLRADHGGTVSSVWNTSSFGALKVMAYDTGSTQDLTIRYGDGFNLAQTLYDSGPWTSPTRGLEPGGSDLISLVDMIGANADFKLYMGGSLLSDSNSILVYGQDSGFLLGRNEGGDLDYNEPLIYGQAAVPIPAAAWLLGTAVVGLVPVMRRRAAQ